MSPLAKLLLRILLAAGLAVMISRFFFGRLTVGTILIGLFLLGMGYVSEYARKKNR